MREKYVLITNLDWVTVGDVRTYTHALLLEQTRGLGRDDVMFKVRGFGTDPAWPVFDIFVKSIDYDLTDAQGNLFKVEGDGVVPVIMGAIMQLKDGTRLDLVTCHRERPLDIQTWEGDSDERLILDVWEVLKRKVPEYWDAPNMPTLQWAPASLVRDLQGVG